VQTIEIQTLREFGIPTAKYVCVEVQMDTSTQVTSDLSFVRNPAWASRFVALKTIVEGKASLYQYTDKSFVLFLPRRRRRDQTT
jgi:hypothetical protein